MYLALHLLTLTGTFLLAVILVRALIYRPLCSISLNNDRINAMLIVASVAWPVSLGLWGTLSVATFLLDFTISRSLLFTAILGAFGWGCSLLIMRRNLLEINKLPPAEADTNRLYWLGLGCIVLPLLIYAYVAIAPFHMWDSMVFYITDSKSIASGWLYSDFAEEGYSVRSDFFSQITDAPSVLAVNDTYIVRVRRWLGLVFACSLVWASLRILQIKPVWVILSIAAFLLAPELSLTGVSGKPDGLVATTELSAALLALVVLSARRLENPLPILAVALYLAALSFSIRMSGVYFALLVLLVFISYLFRWRGPAYLKSAYLAITFIACTSVCVLYFFNWFKVGNPLFWFKAPWPFNGGLYIFDPSDWATLFNLEVFPPLLNGIYLLFHQALGLEIINPYLDRFMGASIFPRPNIGGALGWLTPALLVIFIAPFFIKKSRLLFWAALAFSLWFSIWASGIHYSRLFIAGSSIAIFVGAAIASINPQELNKFQKFLQKGVRLSFWLIPICFMPLHIYLATTRPHNIASLYDNEARYIAKTKYLEGYMKKGYIKKSRLPTFCDSKEVTNVLRDLDRPFVLTNFYRSINILFAVGRFRTHDLTRRDDPLLKSADCYLFNQTEFGQPPLYLRDLFPTERFSNDYWRLICKR
jgi:hypothetical protein